MAHKSAYRVGEVEISVVRRGEPGDLPSLVLLPGTGLTAEDWAVVADDLARDRVVHAVDLRGHGRSGRPGRYSVDLMADDVRGLVTWLGAPVDLVGHSLGGLVACRVAAAAPGLVRGLVLEDVGLLRPREPAPPQRPDGELDLDWRVVEQVRPEIDSPAAHWPATLAAITAPTLVIGGGPRSFVPQDSITELVDLLPDGRVTTLDTGHEVHAARPVEVADLVRAFLAGLA
ncbi:alpha/beta fold hydrolase [Janibacter sp. UYMM211]|uniref:alpha/beta fold hydrolase n=1 Tax=Janibacter sp. UYMM211 TaxID=3156342 RepID=UPI00339931A9